MTVLQIFADAYREMMRPFAIGYFAIMGTAVLVFVGWQLLPPATLTRKEDE